jgi:hypothetical protein
VVVHAHFRIHVGVVTRVGPRRGSTQSDRRCERRAVPPARQ